MWFLAVLWSFTPSLTMGRGYRFASKISERFWHLLQDQTRPLGDNCSSLGDCLEIKYFKRRPSRAGDCIAVIDFSVGSHIPLQSSRLKLVGTYFRTRWWSTGLLRKRNTVALIVKNTSTGPMNIPWLLGHSASPDFDFEVISL